ncbi:HD domain-containing protein [Hydrocoleum sp. CS-953]|uniref:HD domain-containing protein n=1 Tax=Hydrocoleum sp. CS-953 TaxID=1671698 RepID=UPI001AEF40DC|nr:HD domain-containing protein [Hydrocoleum sp. CS-953]
MILSHRFTEALVYATELHAHQIRKGSKVPYVSHLLGVASIALEYGADEDEAIAALLHDAIEDQGGPTVRVEIRLKFGERVTEIVDGCTDTDTTPKPPWKERKKAYINRITNATPSVRLVSAADKLHNIRSILKDYRLQGDLLWDLFKGGKQGTLWYYRSLVTAFREADSTPIVIELDSLVTELEKLVQTDRAEVSL